jgi:NAD(P)-dependent dehydrogenase (short-subunit alcohol dehydrogenase family)
MHESNDMKSIIVLGGAGDMASRAVHELAAEPDVGTVTVADCNLEAARTLASALGNKGSAVWVDANDHDSLVAAIRGHHAAASGIATKYRSRELPSRPAYPIPASATILMPSRTCWNWTMQPKQQG